MIRKIFLFFLNFILIFFTGLFFIKIPVIAPIINIPITTFSPAKNGELAESTPTPTEIRDLKPAQPAGGSEI